MVDRTRFAAIGECMLELRHEDADALKLGFAGDTLNTTVYLARLSDKVDLDVSYITALGDDPYSDMMLAKWHEEGIQCDLVQRLKGKLPGLYFIRTDASGERELYYYRAQAAVREIFKTSQSQSVVEKCQQFDYLYCSGITFAILDTESRKKLLQLLQSARHNGAVICFDCNYREKLWPSAAVASEFLQQVLRTVDIAMPTFLDAQQLFADTSLEATVERLHALGVKEVVIKNGKEASVVSDIKSTHVVPAQSVTKIVDTTAAGDSFNAGYLAARIKGFDLLQAAKMGHCLAATVVQYPGAIISKNNMPRLFK